MIDTLIPRTSRRISRSARKMSAKINRISFGFLCFFFFP